MSVPGSARTPVSLDIRLFSWTSSLAADYAFAHGKLAGFFAGDPSSSAAWQAAVRRARDHHYDRETLTALLASQQARRGAPDAARGAAARLAAPSTVAVVTGQQAGLFGGPLYTLLKALGALSLARRLEEDHGVPAVAVFWIEAEDHDWDEVRTCGVLDAEGRPAAVELPSRGEGQQGPVGAVRLGATVEAAIAGLEGCLPVTEFSDELFAVLRAAYAQGTTMAEAFGRWLEHLLGSRGLVVYDAADPAAKPLAAEVFAREVESGRTTSLAADAGARLEAAGYHAQVEPKVNALALFALEGGGRQPILRDGDGFTVSGRRVTAAELLHAARTSPEGLSPKVILRPVVQDTLFPTVCYVGGASELAYFGQLRGVYEAFGVPMPLIEIRPSATLLDPAAMRFLAKQQVPFEALRAQDDAVLNQLLKSQLPASVDATITEASSLVADRMAAVASAVARIDATLEGAARSTAGRMGNDLKKLHNKIIQAAKRKDETLRRQFGHARAQAFPGGQPQERVVGTVYFLNQYGPALIERLETEVSPEPGVHRVVSI